MLLVFPHRRNDFHLLAHMLRVKRLLHRDVVKPRRCQIDKLLLGEANATTLDGKDAKQVTTH
jgi:hypothetical protein